MLGFGVEIRGGVRPCSLEHSTRRAKVSWRRKAAKQSLVEQEEHENEAVMMTMTMTRTARWCLLQ